MAFAQISSLDYGSKTLTPLQIALKRKRSLEVDELKEHISVNVRLRYYYDSSVCMLTIPSAPKATDPRAETERVRA